MNRVVITGIGAVTPLGNSFSQSWNSLIQGNTGIVSISIENLCGKTTIAGTVKDFKAEKFLNPKELKRLDPFVIYALASAQMALNDSGLTAIHGDKCSVIVGSSRGGITSLQRAMNKLSHSRNTSKRIISPYLMPASTISMAASYISQTFGMKGHTLGISNACAAGTNAIGEAYRLIKHGYSNMALAGGAEAPVCELCILGYNSAGALSKLKTPNASKPFDTDRDGFVLSEGACLVVLEELTAARKRGAVAYAEIIGYGNSSDAFDQVKPDPVGEAKAIEFALKEADLSPKDISHINAHATSTILGDRNEAAAFGIIFGDRLKDIPLSANKSMTGHMLAASGAFETAAAAMTVNKGIIPPTINTKKTDPGLGINLITELSKTKIETAISCSYGFGGVNAVLVLKK